MPACEKTNKQSLDHIFLTDNDAGCFCFQRVNESTLYLDLLVERLYICVILHVWAVLGGQN
jgi:hypothetical protein